MQTVKYTVGIEMPDGDYISPAYLEDLIQNDSDIEDTGRHKVNVKFESKNIMNDTLANYIVNPDVSAEVRERMELTCNSDKNLQEFDAGYLQSKIDAFTEARRKDGKTADDILNECRGGSLDLTWQDIKRIVEIADAVLDFQKHGFLAREDYRWSSEEAYYSYVLEKFKEHEL